MKENRLPNRLPKFSKLRESKSLPLAKECANLINELHVEEEKLFRNADHIVGSEEFSARLIRHGNKDMPRYQGRPWK